MKLTGILWLAALAAAACAAPTVSEDASLYFRARALRQRIERDFIAPRRGLVLTRLKGGDPLEDATLYSGIYLGCLCTAFEVTGDTATAALSRHVLAGLLLDASIGEPGYLVRGVGPDMKTYRGDPSVDQYTAFFYGLFRFSRSPIATPPEKQHIAATLENALARLRRHGWQIVTEDGSRLTAFGRLADIRPTRAERLLSFLAMGVATTENSRWKTAYDQLLPARREALHGFGKFDSWVLIQSALSLESLGRLNKRESEKRLFRQACAETADACLAQMSGFERFLTDPRPIQAKLADRKLALAGVRIPIEAVATVLLVGTDAQARKVIEPLRNMLTHFPIAEAWYSPPLVSLELAYWQAMTRGLFPRPPAMEKKGQ